MAFYDFPIVFLVALLNIDWQNHQNKYKYDDEYYSSKLPVPQDNLEDIKDLLLYSDDYLLSHLSFDDDDDDEMELDYQLNYSPRQRKTDCFFEDNLKCNLQKNSYQDCDIRRVTKPEKLFVDDITNYQLNEDNDITHYQRNNGNDIINYQRNDGIRSCLHCGTWRDPLGVNTLCNACGVQYREGRLLPEYPPAASPSFDDSKQRKTDYFFEDNLNCKLSKNGYEDCDIRKVTKPEKLLFNDITNYQRNDCIRSCLHCGTCDTPLWRKGPLGANTLCNACGVQYRKAMLLPKYRPAASPNFDDSKQRKIDYFFEDNLNCKLQKDSYQDCDIRRLTKPDKLFFDDITNYQLNDDDDITNYQHNDDIRSCLHCGTCDTPLWRRGPLGRNTLCNACGVQYRKGRLLPEYRPAASPSFDDSKHSNYYRRILKKKKKESN